MSGEPTCDLCGKRFPVSSLARACEARHLSSAEEPTALEGT